jgi:hypothetical protein
MNLFNVTVKTHQTAFNELQKSFMVPYSAKAYTPLKAKKPPKQKKLY